MHPTTGPLPKHAAVITALLIAGFFSGGFAVAATSSAASRSVSARVHHHCKCGTACAGASCCCASDEAEAEPVPTASPLFAESRSVAGPCVGALPCGGGAELPGSSDTFSVHRIAVCSIATVLDQADDWHLLTLSGDSLFPAPFVEAPDDPPKA